MQSQPTVTTIPWSPIQHRAWGRRGVAALLLACLAGFAGNALAGPGEKLYRELVEKDQIYQDEEWQAYVQEIGERLLAVSPDAGKKYHFYVLDNPSVNAMALPDGYIFINRGLIAFLRSEDELAGVIGHEIGHVVGNHARRSNRLGAFGNVMGFIGAVMTGTGAVADLANTATATIRSGYGREFELEADEYGGKFLAKAGYNPLAMIDVLHVLKDHQLFSRSVLNEPIAYHGLFSSHPRNDKRLHDAVMKSQGLVPETLMEPERDFWEMMDGLVFGNEAITGLIKDNTYYHGTLRVVFQFPDGWDVMNTASEVVGRAPQGATHSSIAVQRLNPASSEQTPEEFITKTLKRDDVTSGESLEINGYAAYVGEVEVANGTTQARKIAVIYKDSSVYLFRGEVGDVGNVEAFEPQWRQTLESFRAMTAADMRAASNQQIQVVMAKPGDTFAELAKRVSIKSHPEETLRLINGLHPTGEPRAGDFIKIIQ
ncbi:MAG: M48 family metalloprotease [Pseudomonadales bacterium]